ncbi:MAG: hypothetical protein KGK14_04650 [Bacteroidota bacterium]|jgi:hypothetical protein|nr:hypothetical protein [Bacteroidota bacterium]
MKTTVGIFLLLFSTLTAYAQSYFVPITSKKNDFGVDLANVLNNGHQQFNQYKYKAIINKPEEYSEKVQLFQLKKLLPGAQNGFYVVQDKQVSLDYIFATPSNEIDGFNYIKQITIQIYKALNRKLVIVNGAINHEKNTVFEKKMAYAVNNGFFDFNIFLRLIKVSDSSYRVVLHIEPPKPLFYYWVMKQPPIGSFNMVLSLHTSLQLISTNNENGCPIDIMPFTCEGKEVHNDTVFYTYSKSGFDGLNNAIAEYQAAFDNVKSAMGSGYVYYFQKRPNVIGSKAIFVKFSEITKEHYPFITMQLQKNANVPVFSNQLYKIVLTFVMPGY